MPDDTITDTHAKGETPYAVVNLTPSDLEPKDWAFLREWANGLCVSLEVLRTLRGRPTLRSLTASRSFGSISHSRPNLNAFKRFALIIARTLFVVTPNRLAASAVVMIFMAQV